MVYLSVIVLIFFKSSVLSVDVKLFTPCGIHDTYCLSKSTKEFLKKTSSGIPAYDIKCLDPLVIPHLHIKLKEISDITFQFKNLTITGLKDQQFSFLRFNKTARTVILQTKVDLNIVGVMTLEMNENSKSLTGSYSANGTVLGTTNYVYASKYNDKGILHYEVGQEENECQNLFGPQVIYGKELVETLEKDKDLQGIDANQNEIKNRIFCEIVSNAYNTVFHNIRAAARILPRSAFLKRV